MFIKNITGINVSPASSILTISPDGYIRLTFDELTQISFMHLISDLDQDNLGMLQEDVTFTKVSGYTEWVSSIRPSISIGWDWMIELSQRRGYDSYYKRISEPRSNLMLIDERHHDIGSAKTANLVGILLDNITWQTAVQSYISARYIS